MDAPLESQKPLGRRAQHEIAVNDVADSHL